MNKHILPAVALAILSAAASAQDAAPAPAPAPAAPPAAVSALPAPGRVLLPSGPKFDALPPEEKDHFRKMATLRAQRDEAERELLALDDAVKARKDAILEENEEAKALFDRIEALRTEYTAATNALEAIYRSDEALTNLVARMEKPTEIVRATQTSLNREVVDAMHKRMAAQRAALDAKRPAAPERVETPEALGLDPQTFTNLFVAPPRPVPAAGPLPVNPDLKPPLDRRPGERPLAPPPAPAPAAE